MGTRTVTGRLESLQGTQNNRVQFQIKRLTAADSGTRLVSSVDVIADEQGQISAELFTNQQYAAVFPDGSEVAFVLEDGTGDVSLAALIAAAVPTGSPQHVSLLRYIDDKIPALIKPAIDEAAALVAEGAAGKSLLVLNRNPLLEEGNDGDGAVNVNTGDVYRKAGSEWGAPIGNVTGPPGLPGEQGGRGDDGAPGAQGDPGGPGSRIFITGGDPDPALGSDDDLAFSEGEKDVYVKEAGEWRYLGNLTGTDGQNGETGKDGARLYVQDAVPSDDRYNVNDFVLISEAGAAGEIGKMYEKIGPLTWIYRTRLGTGEGGGAETGYLPVRLSEVPGPIYEIDLSRETRWLITKDAAVPIGFTGKSSLGNAVVGFKSPTIGTIHPVTFAESLLWEDDVRPDTDAAGRGDVVLFRSWDGAKANAVVSQRNVSFAETTIQALPNTHILRTFVNDGSRFQNLIEPGRDDIAASGGTNRNPYGVDLTAPENMRSDPLTMNLNASWSYAVVLEGMTPDAVALASGYIVPFGFANRSPTTGDSSKYIRFELSKDANNNPELFLLVRDTSFGARVGAEGGSAGLTFLPLSTDALHMVLIEHNGATREWQMRLLNNGSRLRNRNTGVDATNLYPGGASTNIPDYSLGLEENYGGLMRTGGLLLGAVARARYTAAFTRLLSANERATLYGYAKAHISNIDPSGPQLP